MSNDVQAGLSQNLLNSVSSQVFPKLQSKLTETVKILGGAETMTWVVTKAPTFDLSKNATKAFSMDVALSVTITADKKAGTPEVVSSIGECNVSVSTAGDLSFSMTDIVFTTTDRGLKGILESNKAGIIVKLNSIVQTLKIPLGPIEGTALKSFSSEISNSVLYVAGSISGAATVTPNFSNNGKFDLSLSNGLLKNVMKNKWWPTASKSFSPGHDVTVNLESYNFSVTGGQMQLILNMGGGVRVSCGFLGHARWRLPISPVPIDLNATIDSSNQVNIGVANAALMHVDTPIPENFLAGTISVFSKIMSLLGIQIASLKHLNESEVVNIRKYISGEMYKIPTISSSFEGVKFEIIPKDLKLAVSGSSVDITGSADVTVVG